MKTRARILPLLALPLWLWANPAVAAGVETAFDAANRFYNQGRYAEAAGGYDRLIQSGQASAAVYFNLGNACFKSGQPGRAIAAYRRAKELSPRDADVRANLKFARSQVSGGEPARAAFWKRGMEVMSVNEWTMLAAAAAWLWFGLLALGEWRREWRRASQNLLTGFGLAAGLLAAVAGTAWWSDDFFDSAVVIAKEATVRGGPLDEAKEAFALKDGAELTVLDRRDDWLQVSDRQQRVGWLKLDALALLQP